MTIFSRLIPPVGQPRRWRFHLRSLLIVVLAAALGLAWFARQLRRESEQWALIAQLSQVGIYPVEYEPNSAGFALQAMPVSAQQWLTPSVLKWTFFHCPSRLSAFSALRKKRTSVGDDDVPDLINMLRRFPYLKSVSFQHGQVSLKAQERIRKALPGVEVDVDANLDAFLCTSQSCAQCAEK